MTKKLVPIGNHKEKDLRLVRIKLLEIINSDDSKAKDITDASKLLARMHKALQPDKTIERTTRTDKPRLKDEHRADLAKILDDK